MIEFGETLRQAREAKGLTTSQVAQTTHLLVQQIEALEREDFSRIAAPIYGRGFVKIYCDALGLDPKPLVAEFMEIYSGNRQPTIKMRRPPVDAAQPPKKDPLPSAPPPLEAPATAAQPTGPEPQPAPEPPSAQEASPEPETPPASEPVFDAPAAPTPAPEPNKPPAAESSIPPVDQPTFSLESETVRAPSATRQTFAFDREPSVFDDDFLTQKPKSRPSWSSPTMADDYADDGFRLPKIPKTVWRMLALAAVAVALLWLVISGFRALYRATMHAPDEDGTAQTEESASSKDTSPATTTPAPAPATTPDGGKPPADTPARKPMKIPPLYID